MIRFILVEGSWRKSLLLYLLCKWCCWTLYFPDTYRRPSVLMTAQLQLGIIWNISIVWGATTIAKKSWIFLVGAWKKVWMLHNKCVVSHMEDADCSSQMFNRLYACWISIALITCCFIGKFSEIFWVSFPFWSTTSRRLKTNNKVVLYLRVGQAVTENQRYKVQWVELVIDVFAHHGVESFLIHPPRVCYFTLQTEIGRGSGHTNILNPCILQLILFFRLF